MREILLRLRAALTPQALLLVTALLLLGVAAAQRTGGDALEERVSRTLSAMEGAGRVHVTIRTQEIAQPSAGLGASKTQSVPLGALVVAQGADDPLVALKIREALCALLGIPAASVSIVTGGK